MKKTIISAITFIISLALVSAMLFFSIRKIRTDRTTVGPNSSKPTSSYIDTSEPQESSSSQQATISDVDYQDSNSSANTSSTSDQLIDDSDDESSSQESDYLPQNDVDGLYSLETDSLAPTISVYDFVSVGAVNLPMSLPKVIVNTYSGNAVTPTIKVINEDGITTETVSNGKFIPSKGGIYSILVTAKDGSYTTTKSIDVSVRNMGEFESCDRPSYVEAWVLSGGPSLSYSTEKVKKGTGSLLFQSKASGFTTWPGMKMTDPSISSLADAYSISFWVFNDSDCDFELLGTPNGKVIGTAFKNIWTKMEILASDYAAFGYDINNFKDFFVFVTNNNKNVKFYYDDFQINKQNLSPSITGLENSYIVANNSIFSIPKPDIDCSVTVLNPKRELVPIVNDQITVNEPGTYYVIYYAVSGDYESMKVIKVIVNDRKLGEIESGDSIDYLASWTTRRSSISFNSDRTYIKYGTGSIRVTGASSDINLGNYPDILMTNPTIKDISNMYSISMWVYNNSAEDVQIETLSGASSAVFGTALKGQWTRLELTKAQFEALTGWTGSKYNLRDFKDFNLIFKNVGFDLDIYIDNIYINYSQTPQISFMNGYNDDRTVGDIYTLPSANVTGLGNGVVTSFVVIKDGSIVAVNNNSFTTALGTYTVICNATDVTGNSAQSIYKFRVNEIRESRPNQFLLTEIASDLNDWSVNTGTFSLNKDQNYLRGENVASIKYSSASSGYPTINLYRGLVKDISGYYSLSFWVFNDSDKDITVYFGNGYNTQATFYKKQWTRVELPISLLRTNTAFNVNNFTNLTMLYNNNDGEMAGTFVNLYFEDFYLNPTSTTCPSVSFNSGYDAHTEGSNYVFPTPIITGGTAGYTTEFIVMDGTQALLHNGTDISLSEGRYRVICNVIDANGKETQIIYTLKVDKADADKDVADLFAGNGYSTISTNSESVGLHGTDSSKSVKIHLAGYGYPTITVNGDMSDYKSIKFWVLVKTNEYSNGFIGPLVPISNMTTGAQLGVAKLDQWVQVTIDFGSMNNNSFGFLQDRFPLNAGSLDIYIDNVEFIAK